MPQNEESFYSLCLEKLRLKTLVLLAFCLMVRPSDIAPNAVVWNENQKSWCNLQFTKDRIQFAHNGTVSIYIHGSKNDYDWNGAQIFLQPSKNSKMCPVRVL